MLNEVYNKHRNKMNECLSEFDILKDMISSCWYEVYNDIENDLRKTILGIKEEKIEANKEIREVYWCLSYEKCKILVKSIMPLRVKLLNKIIVNGYGINDKENGITVIYYLNNMDSHCFKHTFGADYIKKTLNINREW